MMKTPMKIFRNISWMSGGHGGGNNRVEDVIELSDELYVFVDELRVFVINYACL
jgi:hypothetical protein